MIVYINTALYKIPIFQEFCDAIYFFQNSGCVKNFTVLSFEYNVSHQHLLFEVECIKIRIPFFSIYLIYLVKFDKIIEAIIQTLERPQDRRNAFSAAHSPSRRQSIAFHQV